MDTIITISATIASIIITFLVTRYFYIKQVNDLNKGIKLYDVAKGKVNTQFYRKFKSYISNAKKLVLITGRGLKMDTDDEISLANGYLNAFKEALRKAEVVRIQFGEDASYKWYQACYEIWIQNKEKFHFYIMESQEDLLHTAAIDPYQDECIGEMMMPSTVIASGGDKKDIAGTAIFFKEKPGITISIAERIISLRNEGLKKGICQKIDSENIWEEVIEKARN